MLRQYFLFPVTGNNMTKIQNYRVINSSLRTVHLYLILSRYPKLFRRATGFQKKLAQKNTNKLCALKINYNLKEFKNIT
jgi:hypothetical protein